MAKTSGTSATPRARKEEKGEEDEEGEEDGERLELADDLLAPRGLLERSRLLPRKHAPEGLGAPASPVHHERPEPGHVALVAAVREE